LSSYRVPVISPAVKDALLWLALIFGILKIGDFTCAFWALVLCDPAVSRVLEARLSARAAVWLVPRSAREWNDRDVASWTPIFAWFDKHKPSHPVPLVLGILVVQVGFRSPVLSLLQSGAVFAWASQSPRLAIAVAATATFGIASTIVYFLVSLSLDNNRPGVRAGYVAYRGGTAGVTVLTPASSNDASEFESEDEPIVPAAPQEAPIPSLLFFPVTIAALLGSYAALYYALSAHGPNAFVVRNVPEQLSVMQAIYFSTSGRDASPFSAASQAVATSQVLIAVTALALFVSAANSALRRAEGQATPAETEAQR
jgi:hypothetical protein